jgi:hypothetical protein
MGRCNGHYTNGQSGADNNQREPHLKEIKIFVKTPYLLLSKNILDEDEDKPRLDFCLSPKTRCTELDVIINNDEDVSIILSKKPINNALKYDDIDLLNLIHSKYEKSANGNLSNFINNWVNPEYLIPKPREKSINTARRLRQKIVRERMIKHKKEKKIRLF